jgi:C-22 sterol desaturase
MAAAAVAQNISFTSPLADAKFAQIVGHPQISNFLTSIIQLSAWKVIATILLILVAYDQCK